MSRGGKKGRRTRAVQKPDQQATQPRIERRLELVASQYEGPIPPPEMLQGYEDVHPGAVAWILEQAKDQGKHRRKLERRIVNWGTFAEVIGSFSTLAISLAVIGGGIFLIFNDKDGAGFGVIVANLTALVIAYKAGIKRT